MPSTPPHNTEDPLDRGLKVGFSDAKGPSSSILQFLQARAGSRLGVHLPDSESSPEVPIKVSDEAKALRDPSGRYQVVGEIARGGMGVVYKGRDVDLGRDVAMKVLNEKYVDQPEILERFVEEAQIGGQLQHPGIVPVYELGMQHGERPYFAMKLVKGETLAEHLARRQDPGDDRRRFLGIFEQVCQTLAYAHARQVVHRDLKPANIMIGPFGEVQVVDWGLAKVLPRGGVADEKKAAETSLSMRSVISTVRSSEGSDSNTVMGSKLGTPAYMPPEQAGGDVDEMDRRSDVFGLGAILCEILTGAPPYLKEDGELLQQAMLGDVSGARARIENSGADEVLVRLCKQCIFPVRPGRPESAQQVAEEVGKYLSSVEERARAAELRAVEAKVKTRATRMLAGIAVLVLALGSGTYLWLQNQASNRRAGAEQQVAQTVSGANELLGRAREAGYQDLGLWDRATVGLEQAEGLAVSADVSQATREDVQQRLTEARIERESAQQEAALISRDEDMLARLTELRIPVDEDMRGKIWPKKEARRLDAAYAAAFETYLDLDLVSLSTEDAVRALSEGELEIQLAAALDHWAMERNLIAEEEDAPDPVVTDRLRAIARRLDLDDPWRNQLRDLLPSVLAQRGALEALADTVDYESQPATGLLTLGEALWRAEDKERAIEVYARGQEIYPKDFWITFRRGLLLAQLDEPRIGEALQAYRIAVALRPDMNQVWHMMGMALDAMKDYDGALRIYGRLTVSDAQDAHWTTHKGFTLQKRGDPAEALANFRRAIEIDPEHAWAHLQMGDASRQSGDLDKAIASYRRVIEIEPDHAKGHGHLGWALGAQGDRKGAVVSLRKAIEIDPEFGRAHANLGRNLRSQGDLEAAAASLRRGIELNPEYAWAHTELGVTLKAIGDLDGAIASFRRALAVIPDEGGAMDQLGHALVENGDLDEALEIFLRMTELDTASPHGHSWAGLVLARQGRFEEAYASHYRAVVIRQSDADANNAFAWFLATAADEEWRNAEDAVLFARRAVRAAPNNAYIRNTLGVALYRAGAFEEALVELDRSMELSGGGRAGGWLFYAMVLHRLGRATEASEWFEKGRAAVEAMPEVTDELARFLAEATKTLAGSDERDG